MGAVRARISAALALLALLIMSADNYLVDSGVFVVRIGGSNQPRSLPMSNVIQFPAAADRAMRRFEVALSCYDIETIVELALASEVAEVRDRAARWLAEVMNIRVSA